MVRYTSKKTKSIAPALQIASSSTASVNLDLTFHPFPRLPIELRQEILTLAIPEPRTVALWTYKGEYDGIEAKWKRLAGTRAIPTPLLHVDKETREFAKKWYTLMPTPQRHGSAVWFDFNRDTLRVGKSIDCLYGVHTSTVSESQLAHMADIEAKVKFLIVHNSFRCTTIGLVSRFNNLQTLQANYDMKIHTEKLMVKQMTKRAKDNGWELKIPIFQGGSGAWRQLKGV